MPEQLQKGLAEVNGTSLYYEVAGQDAQAILTIADTLEKGIAGARKLVIPGTAHHPNMEKPEEFNHVVIEFLEQIGPYPQQRTEFPTLS